jgi:hypothetical protein
VRSNSKEQTRNFFRLWTPPMATHRQLMPLLCMSTDQLKDFFVRRRWTRSTVIGVAKRLLQHNAAQKAGITQTVVADLEFLKMTANSQRAPAWNPAGVVAGCKCIASSNCNDDESEVGRRAAVAHTVVTTAQLESVTVTVVESKTVSGQGPYTIHFPRNSHIGTQLEMLTLSRSKQSLPYLWLPLRQTSDDSTVTMEAVRRLKTSSKQRFMVKDVRACRRAGHGMGFTHQEMLSLTRHANEHSLRIYAAGGLLDVSEAKIHHAVVEATEQNMEKPQKTFSIWRLAGPSAPRKTVPRSQ